MSDRRRLAAVVLAGFAAFLGLHAPQPLLPTLKELFQVSTGRISLIIREDPVPPDCCCNCVRGLVCCD